MKHFNLKNWMFMGLLGACCALFLISCQRAEEPSPEEGYEQLLDANFKAYELFTLDYEPIYTHVKKNLGTQFDLNLGIPDHPEWTFSVWQDHLEETFAEGAAGMVSYEVTSSGMVIEHPMHEIIAVEGALRTGSEDAAFLFALGRLEGLFYINGVEWIIEPVFNYDIEAPQNQYILYRTEDAIATDFFCEETGEHAVPGVGGFELQDPKAANCYVASITYLADYKFYTDKFASNFDNTINWMYDRFYWGRRRYNGYYNTTVASWTVQTQYCYTSANSNPSTYTNKTTFINEWDDFYGYSWYNEGDCNVLWTGYNVSGVWGKAQGIGKICLTPSQSFCFCEKMSTTSNCNNLIAHEVGHSMGMHHDGSSNNFMNASYSNWNTSLGVNANSDLSNHLANWHGCTPWTTCP